MRYVIERQFSVHTGGTKYYQTVIIHRAGSLNAMDPTIAAWNYGTFKRTKWGQFTDDSRSRIEKTAGTNCHELARSKRDEKRKMKAGGAYSDWVQKTIDCNDEDELRKELNGIFGFKVAADLFAWMTGAAAMAGVAASLMSPIEDADEEAEDQPKVEIENIPTDPLWGSW